MLTLVSIFTWQMLPSPLLLEEVSCVGAYGLVYITQRFIYPVFALRQRRAAADDSNVLISLRAHASRELRSLFSR